MSKKVLAGSVRGALVIFPSAKAEMNDRHVASPMNGEVLDSWMWSSNNGWLEVSATFSGSLHHRTVSFLVKEDHVDHVAVMDVDRP